MKLTAASTQECAREVLETIPATMRAIAAHMRARSAVALSVPQFRAMLVLRRREGASLSEVAEFLGLSLPSCSKLVDALVARGMVARDVHPEDRRRIALTLTAAGRDTLRAARDAAQAHLAKLLAALPPDQLSVVAEGMRALRAVFATEHAEGGEVGRPR